MCGCFTAKQLHLVTADSRSVRLIRGMKALRGHAASGARAHLVAETPPHDFTAFSTGARTASRLLPWGLVLFHGSAGASTASRLLSWGLVLFTAPREPVLLHGFSRGDVYCFTAPRDPVPFHGFSRGDLYCFTAPWDRCFHARLTGSWRFPVLFNGTSLWTPVHFHGLSMGGCK